MTWYTVKVLYQCIIRLTWYIAKVMYWVAVCKLLMPLPNV